MKTSLPVLQLLGFTILNFFRVYGTRISGSNVTTRQNAETLSVLNSSQLPRVKLDVSQPRRDALNQPSICDAGAHQISGYLDITTTTHMFFWFVEARKQPPTAPLVLWLSGGPGCTSLHGLFVEIGPCTFKHDGSGVGPNPYSWNEEANLLFLDQPLGSGFSYANDGQKTSTSPEAAEHIYAFLQVFFERFPQYSNSPVHIAGESYAGMFILHLANAIHRANRRLGIVSDANSVHINLASIIIGNGLTHPYIQHPSISDFVCDGPFPLYPSDDPRCSDLKSKAATCQTMIAGCQQQGRSSAACLEATTYCTQAIAPVLQSGINPQDVRLQCNAVRNGPHCYAVYNQLEEWMNDLSNQAAIGVSVNQHVEVCSSEVAQAFLQTADQFQDSASLLPEIVNDGVRLLVYAGNADMLCNFIGNERWVESLETVFYQEFKESKPAPWKIGATGKTLGVLRTAGGQGRTAGNVTFVTVHDAGHMVPYDQPEAALDLFTHWMKDIPLD